MKVLKGIMCAAVMVLLSANFVFGQSFTDRTPRGATDSFDIGIVDMTQRQTNNVIVPLSPMIFPVTVEILGREGNVVFERITDGTSVRVALIGAPNAYTLNVYQGGVLVMTTPYLEL